MESKFVSKFKKKIEALVIEIDEARSDIIYSREEIFNDRSEKWQESDNGTEYEEKTYDFDDEIDDIISGLESASEDLDRVLEL